jgi:Zn-dependent metalloprotease
VARDVITDSNGTTHVRYDRTFAGLRVLGGDLVVHESATGAIRSTTYNATGAVAVVSTIPTLAAATARAAGVRRAKLASPRSSDELVVYAASGRPTLAYDIVVTGTKADQTPSRLHTIVDARTGKALASWDDIETGTGNSIYTGTVTIGTSKNAGTGLFELRDPIRGASYTTDLNGATSGNGAVFTDSDDVWGNGSTSSRQSAAVDAQYGSGVTWDFYRSVLGRNGIFGNGTGARSRVHYGNAYVNAFWDGTQMSYGDGAGNTHPLTELDVTGHEMSHGVTENTAALAYTGDAGGLNEATSDIFGTSVEFFANNANDVGDYLIGEKIDINGNGTPLRYMDKPSRDGASKDCWSSTLGNLDPHYSSGPLNHWFYLASEGSGAKTINGVPYNSSTCDGSTLSGIGRDAAVKIWYRALSTYLTSSSNYAAARNAAIRAARDLYGATSTQCTGVAAAFGAIAVPAGTEACSGGTTPPPTGGNLLLNPGFESGAVNWTGTAGPITNNTGRAARTGSWKLWLGGNGTAGTETESQSVTIPATATAATLSFWIVIDTAETTSTSVYDTATVKVVSGTSTTTLASYSNLNRSTGYVQKTFDLTSFKGRTVTVTFTDTEDSSLQTSFVIDDTALATS